MKNMLL